MLDWTLTYHRSYLQQRDFVITQIVRSLKTCNVHPCSFYMEPLPTLTYVPFSELFHPLSKNVPRCLWKLGSEQRENNYFFQSQHKRWQCVLHRYIYYNKKIFTSHESHVKFSSIITPRNLIESSLLLLILLNVIVGSCDGRESHIEILWNKTYFVFFAFSERLLC